MHISIHYNIVFNIIFILLQSCFWKLPKPSRISRISSIPTEIGQFSKKPILRHTACLENCFSMFNWPDVKSLEWTPYFRLWLDHVPSSQRFRNAFQLMTPNWIFFRNALGPADVIWVKRVWQAQWWLSILGILDVQDNKSLKACWPYLKLRRPAGHVTICLDFDWNPPKLQTLKACWQCHVVQAMVKMSSSSQV